MRAVYLFFMFSGYVFSQETFVLPKDIETKGYTLAIGEYIKELKIKGAINFDTLFVGKHEELLNITLPSSVENKIICLVTNEESEKKFQYHTAFCFINMVGDFRKEVCFFNLVTFKAEKTPEKNYWWPLHNYHVNFNYDLKTEAFNPNKTSWEYPYSNKYAAKNRTSLI